MNLSDCDEHAQAKVLRALPGVKTLHIQSRRSTIYRLLTLGRTKGDLCPDLESFLNGLTPDDADAMYEFLLSRLRSPRPFHAVTDIAPLSGEVRHPLRDHPELSPYLGTFGRITHWKNQWTVYPPGFGPAYMQVVTAPRPTPFSLAERDVPHSRGTFAKMMSSLPFN